MASLMASVVSPSMTYSPELSTIKVAGLSWEHLQDFRGMALPSGSGYHAIVTILDTEEHNG